MKVALTGAIGVVGSGILPRLRETGYQIRLIDRNTLGDNDSQSVVRADLTDPGQTIEALRGVDAIIHLAGISSPRKSPDVTVHNDNVRSSYNVLSAAAELGISRVVQASSVNAIGLTWSRDPVFDYFPIDLAHPSRVEDGYSLSKLIQEAQADALTRRHDGLSVVSLRLHAVLADAGGIPDIRAMNPEGQKLAADSLFGYCTFASVADAILLGLKADIRGHERLFVVEPETFSTIPSATLAAEFFPDVPLRSPLTGCQGFFDISRTRDLLGWVPSTELSGKR